jgi:hypothetical protein
MAEEGRQAGSDEGGASAAAERPSPLSRVGLYLSLLPLAASLIYLFLRPG